MLSVQGLPCGSERMAAMAVPQMGACLSVRCGWLDILVQQQGCAGTHVGSNSLGHRVPLCLGRHTYKLAHDFYVLSTGRLL